MPTNTDVTKLKINSLTEAQFDAAVQSGVIGANEISFITDLDEAIQVNSLPTADASQEGKIYQYIGDTVTNVFCTVTDSDLDPYPTITIDYTKLKAALDTQGVVLGESGGLDISYEVDAEEGTYIPVISVTPGDEAFFGETFFSTPEEAFASIGIIFSETPHYVQADYTIQTLFSNGYFYKCVDELEVISGTASVEEYINSNEETPDPENIPTFIFNKEVFDACISDQGKPANTGTKVKFSYWADPDEGIPYVKAEYNSGDFVLSMAINDYGSEMNETLAKFGFTTNFCPVEEREPTDEEWEIVDQQMFDRNGYIIVSLPTNNVYAWTRIDTQPIGTYTAGEGISIANNKISVTDPVLVNKTSKSHSLAISDHPYFKDYNIGTNSIYIGRTTDGFSNARVGNNAVGIGLNNSGSADDYGTAINAQSGKYSVFVGSGTTSDIGNHNTGIGYKTGANLNTKYGVAIGVGAYIGADNTIQICAKGNDTNVYNNDANTFKVANANGNYEIMSANGTIPEARLADTTNAQAGQVLTLDGNLNAVWQAGGAGGNSVPQYDIMPTAGADNVGSIAQYAGTTDSDYTNGYFYKCVSDSEITGITISPATQSGTVLTWAVDGFNNFLDYFCERAHIDDKTEVAKITIEYQDGYMFTVTAYDSTDLEIGHDMEDRNQLVNDFGVGNLLSLTDGDQVTVTPTTGTIYNWEQANTQDKELPDLTSAYGYLFTNGTTLSWSRKPLINGASGSGSLAVGDNAMAGDPNAITIGSSAQTGGMYRSSGAVVIGYNAYSDNAPLGIAIGCRANSQAAGAIQIGGSSDYSTRHINSDANTLKIGNANGNFELMSADGTIPEARLADTTSATQGQVLTLNANGNAEWANPSTGGPTSLTVTLQGGSSNWASNTQTVTVQGVTATNTIFAGAAPASVRDYDNAGIICVAQNTDELTFECVTVPTNNITVNVLIIA